MLINLLGNAVKFTHSGGIEVHVSVESNEPREVCLRFVVIDSGIGIPGDKQAVIFQPFSQADGSMTRKYGGTGLGLTISARLVELMRGRIWVTSDPGKGSAFNFTASFGVGESRSATASRTLLSPSAVSEPVTRLHRNIHASFMSRGSCCFQCLRASPLAGNSSSTLTRFVYFQQKAMARAGERCQQLFQVSFVRRQAHTWLSLPAERSAAFLPTFSSGYPSPCSRRAAGTCPNVILSKPQEHFRDLEDGLPDAGLSGQPSFPRASADRAYL